MEETEFKAYSALLQNSFETRRGNVAEGLFAIADALKELTVQVNRLGNGDLNNPGAIEVLGDRLTEKMDELTDGIGTLKEATELISAAKT